MRGYLGDEEFEPGKIDFTDCLSRGRGFISPEIVACGEVRGEERAGVGSGRSGSFGTDEFRGDSLTRIMKQNNNSKSSVSMVES
jgi:hypothetical protein